MYDLGLGKWPFEAGKLIQSYWQAPWNSAQQGVNVAALTTVKTKHTTSDEQIIRLA